MGKGEEFTTAQGGKRGFPSPREVWQRFRGTVDGDKERRRWVKRIAVAAWMTVGDVEW